MKVSSSSQARAASAPGTYATEAGEVFKSEISLLTVIQAAGHEAIFLNCFEKNGFD